jgi:prephenate dehydratase
MKTHNITFLGPVGATFSHDAYNTLATMYRAPSATEQNCIPASTNGEVLKMICEHGGYGAIAMETLAEGRVAEPLESFIALLKDYEELSACPIHIAGSVQMKLHFCLMVRQDVDENAITAIVAHPKALGACKGNIEKTGRPTKDAPSNGEAARLVAEDEVYKTCAALGPRSAAEKYGLKILNDAFEDKEAITTFFLVTPAEHEAAIGKKNRALIVYKVPHQPGALVRSLLPFEAGGLNLIQIHSVHAGNHTYNFAIEIEVNEGDLSAWERAMRSFESCADKHLVFGPFTVLST